MSGSPTSTKRSKSWKQRERDIAAFHGLVRNPLSGANSGRVGDAYDPCELLPWVYIEAKHYERHAAISILQKHREQVKKVDKEGLCIAALSENRKHGFYVLVHNEDVIEYATLLLRKHGYQVRLEGEEDASQHSRGDGQHREGLEGRGEVRRGPPVGDGEVDPAS